MKDRFAGKGLDVEYEPIKSNEDGKLVGACPECKKQIIILDEFPDYDPNNTHYFDCWCGNKLVIYEGRVNLIRFLIEKNYRGTVWGICPECRDMILLPKGFMESNDHSVDYEFQCSQCNSYLVARNKEIFISKK